MRLAWLAAAGALLACAFGSARVETLSRAPTFRAKVLALAATRGAGSRSAEISGALVRRLQSAGIRASSLEDSDSVVAGASLGLDVAGDPRVLAEIRRATGAEALVLLTLDADWLALDVAVVDAATGDVVLRAAARPAGGAFASPREVAAAAAQALSQLASSGRPASGEIPLPDVDGGNP